jgi:hypothetical protein
VARPQLVRYYPLARRGRSGIAGQVAALFYHGRRRNRERGEMREKRDKERKSRDLIEFFLNFYVEP